MSITGIKYSFFLPLLSRCGCFKALALFHLLFQLFWLSASFLNGVHLSSMKHLKDFSKSAFTEIHIKATNVKEDSNIAAVVIHWLL